MTPEQIDLEFTHILIDKKLKDKESGKEVYVDAEYDDYDNETDEHDSKLSDMPVFGSDTDPNSIDMVKIHEQARQEKEDDWEDVETDD